MEAVDHSLQETNKQNEADNPNSNKKSNSLYSSNLSPKNSFLSKNSSNVNSKNNVVIARKLSGRYLKNKKISSNSIVSSFQSVSTSKENDDKTNRNQIDPTNESNSNLNDKTSQFCVICFMNQEDENEPLIRILCGHKFCKECWKQ